MDKINIIRDPLNIADENGKVNTRFLMDLLNDIIANQNDTLDIFGRIIPMEEKKPKKTRVKKDVKSSYGE